MLRGYEIHQDSAIGGKATKWVARGPGGEDDFYIAKFGNKNGRVEILTELFNNRLGVALGCDMAHSGIARLDEHLYFITRNFRQSEELIHGSLMIESTFGAKKELDNISPKSEQSFYSINFIVDVFKEYCGEAAESVLNKLFEMLVFDAFIGSMDRHAKNWGVLRSGFSVPVSGGAKYRLAPIFDSARALLWDLPEGKLLLPDNDDTEIVRYAESSRPCIGPDPDHPKVNDCNHFDFMLSLLDMCPHPIRRAYDKFPVEIGQIARKLLYQFPFGQGFSSMRKRLIIKVLSYRADKLREIFSGKGNP
jgi:hypothetical protein